MQPDKVSVAKSIEECEALGEDEFLKRHASGARPRGHYVFNGGKRYPLKAIWAAAHVPPIHTRRFKTDTARRSFRRLGFECTPERNST
jgi:hypothetical protein